MAANSVTQYRVHFRGRYRYFLTLDDARAFCGAVLQQTGIVCAITATYAARFGS